MPAGADLIGDIPDLEWVRVHASLGHESADARHPHQHPVSRQLAQGPVGGHPRHFQLANQLVLRRHARTRAQTAARDLLQDVLLNLEVAGGCWEWLWHESGA
jgi:hypothetical protein